MLQEVGCNAVRTKMNLVFTSFAQHLIVTTPFQALLTTLSGCFSVFVHTTECAIGLGIYLELGVNTPEFALPTQGTLLWIPTRPRAFRLQGFNLL